MKHPLQRALSICAIGLAATVGGCGGSDAEPGGDRPAAAKERSQLNGADRPDVADFPKPKPGQTMQQFANSIGATGTQAALGTSVFTPGHNRLAFGVLNAENAIVYGPTAVYVARSPRSRDVTGPYAAPADLLVTEPAFRSQQAATEADPFAAIYEATGVEFSAPGQHSLLIVTRLDDQLVAAPTQVRVRKESPVPDVGEPAPPVQTATVASGGGEEAVDTRRPTAPELHETSFSDVVGKKPVALLFATPQFCESRVCGPVVDIALQLEQEYGDRVEFIHQEVFEDNDPNKGLREPLRRFGLPTEPWLFTVDAQGRVAARLEGSFGLRGFERAVQAAIARS